LSFRVSEPTRICLVSASGQNVFFSEILEAFGAALRDEGLTVERSVDCFPEPAEDLVYLYVPHEYHPMVHELAYPSPVQVRRSVAICTEQPGTHWFDISCDYAARVGGVVDINALGAREMRGRSVEAEHAPLGYVPSWDAWRGRKNHERSVDLTFLGAHTERRGRVLGRCASALAERRAALHLTESAQPHVAGSSYFLSGEAKWRHLADSKVLLNIHQQELAYMEWHRVIGAVLNGCVVLSEHSIDTGPFVPGEHFVSASYEHLPGVLEALLAEPERLSEIRHAAYALVRAEMPLEIATAAILSAAERANDNRIRKGGPAPRPAPMALDPPERKPEWEVYAEWVGEQLPTRRALKELMVRTRELERRLERSEASDGEEDLVERLGPDPGRPQVSVLLTVHNYADFVTDALRSVALSDLHELEVVAIDDASRDGSADAIRTACAELPWLSVKLVQLAHNRGLPAARNLAAEHARADLLFILDADNMVFPKGIRLLAEALEENREAAFAYGLLETFDINGPVGIASWLDWNPTRLRYGNYIDAMSLIRRSALEAVGGYSTDAAFAGGWEDFALWVAMADAGLNGVRLPDFVARYREAPHSMVALTNVDTSATWAALIRKHPSLAESTEKAANG
jgi:Glycosyl transferase family 2